MTQRRQSITVLLVEIDSYSLSFIFIKSTNGNRKMNLRKWLSKTKETLLLP